MFTTTLEWYKLSEKLPFDGKIFTKNEYAELLAIITLNNNGEEYTTIQPYRYLDGRFGIYHLNNWVDCTDTVLYWAYMPKLDIT